MYRLIPVLLLSGNVLGALVPGKPYYDLAEAEKHFAEFMLKHNKIYESNEEFKKRFEIFKANIEKINHWNKNEGSAYDVNSMTDITYEELTSIYCGANKYAVTNETEKFKIPKEWIRNAPNSLDYRTQGLVTEVKNQGRCGSCYVFGAIGNIEGQYAKNHGSLVSLSEQQGLDCSQGSCDGGRPIFVINGLSQQGGSMKEEDYPYNAVQGQCQTAQNKVVVKVTSGQELSTPTEEDLQGAVAQYGPLATGIFVSEQIRQASGSVIAPTDCSGQHPNHIVLVVGYGTDSASGKDYWIIKNSWGTGYGAEGYLLLEKGQQLCGIGSDFSTTSQVE